MAGISNAGFYLPLEIRTPGRFGPLRATVYNPDGTPMDLSNGTVSGQIRAVATAGAAVYTFDVDDTDSADGVVALSLEETSLLVAQKYVWDVIFMDAYDSIAPLCLWYGPVIVVPGVTR